ncbi:MAG: putative metallo-hydrolase YycJ [Planctomycetota bacterium]|jgi:phosphoribosyl 1,2-cyclic phosphodiesterase
MALQFTVLASGSKGNSALISIDGRHSLIDVGLSARHLGKRLDQFGLRFSQIQEVILTHTHGDHVHGTALEALAKHGVRFWCHDSHVKALKNKPGFQDMVGNGLVSHYRCQPFESLTGLRVAPIELQHGPGQTFGFRVNHDLPGKGLSASIGYLADVGCWNESHVSHFLNCNLLAIEFNHDVQMTRESGRHPMVIHRNLSDDGHLSNDQASELLQLLIQNSTMVKPSEIVLLHISGDCNTEELALKSAQKTVEAVDIGWIPVTAARQDSPLEPMPVSYVKREGDPENSGLKSLVRNDQRRGVEPEPHTVKSEHQQTHMTTVSQPVKKVRPPRRWGRDPNQLELIFPG